MNLTSPRQNPKSPLTILAQACTLDRTLIDT
jgi:hypothetical protein